MSYEFPGMAWLGEEWGGEGVDRAGRVGPSGLRSRVQAEFESYKTYVWALKWVCGL